MILHRPWITGIALLALWLGAALPALAAPTAVAHQRCPECREMVEIQAGDFMRGMSLSEQGRLDTEGPRQRVHIGAFDVSKYPVTRGQWRMHADTTGYRTRKHCDWPNPGFPQDDPHSVVCVSWQQTQDFIVWLNKQSGEHFRLVTEAEHEYVNRAGTTTAYFWGDSDNALALYANGNAKGTTRVGSF
jgi:formylglycine-generating enzyme required for sulfatase activity